MNGFLNLKSSGFVKARVKKARAQLREQERARHLKVDVCSEGEEMSLNLNDCSFAKITLRSSHQGKQFYTMPYICLLSPSFKHTGFGKLTYTHTPTHQCMHTHTCTPTHTDPQTNNHAHSYTHTQTNTYSPTTNI